MPDPYEIRIDSGYRKDIYAPCIICGKFRWTRLVDDKPRASRCKDCVSGESSPRWKGGKKPYVKITPEEWAERKRLSKIRKHKKNHERHKERMLTDPEYHDRMNEYHRDYCAAHRKPRLCKCGAALEPGMRICNDCRIKNRRLREKNRRDKRREKALEVWGRECIICGNNRYISIHRKDFKPHRTFGDMSNAEFENAVAHKNEYEALCNRHHKLRHSSRA